MNYSCTRSNAFLAAAHAAARVRKADKLGIHAQVEVTSISKNGRRRGKQCYICHACGRQFLEIMTL